MGDEADSYFDKLPFSVLCDACEKIITKGDKKRRSVVFQNFINHHRSKCNGGNFHPLLRLFLPNLERERGAYGVKENTLAKTYIRILCLPKEGVDAQRLLNYRAPTNVRASDVTGDFAEVAYWVLRNKCGQSTKITIGEINSNLDAIAEKHASHEPRAVDDILITLFRRMSAEEQKWFIRVVLKNMNLGLSNKQIMYTFHPDAWEVYELSNSLLKVCTMLRYNTVRLHEIEITVFESFRPMLSERCDVTKLNFSEPLLLETKFDGERFQLHFSDEKFKYFSRNGYEYTQEYGVDQYSGFLSSLIRKQFSQTLVSVILDGEMMGWDTKRSRIVTKAANIDVKKLKVGNIVQPCFFPFDILHYNGEVLTNKPLMERKKLLEASFDDLEGTIVKAPYSTVSSNDEILDAVNAAIDRCEEGIILKKMDSVYKPNSRSSGWYKIKPEYTEGGLVDLDLLIIGGYYGQKRHKGKVSHFMMGLAVPNSDGGYPTQFESLCRVGSGYSDPELERLTSRLAPFWQKLRPGNIPNSHLLSKEKPDLWIPPEKSCILQIKATEVVESNAYYGGSTLKFVRVQQIREDKPWYDCLTTSEFQNIKQVYQGKLTSGHLNNATGKTTNRKKTEEIESLVSKYSSATSVDQTSRILEGKEFCVISGLKELSKEGIAKVILENGGSVSKVPGSKTFCLIVGDMNIRVKNLIKAGKHTVAQYSWLQQCLESKKLVDLNPQTLVGTTLKGMCSLNQKFDQFGDSYLQFIDEAALISIMKKMDQIESVRQLSLQVGGLREIDTMLFGSSGSPFSVFRGVKAYFAYCSQLSELEEVDMDRRMKFCATIFQFCGGVCADRIDNCTNFIIVDRNCCTKNPVTKGYAWRMEEVPHLDVTVSVSNEFKSGALEILESIRPQWASLDVVFKTFTDGITNTLFGCCLNDEPQDTVLIRCYGNNTELFIDRKAETRNFKILHKYDYAPRLYATFNNGLAYEFVPGETLNENTVKDPAIFPLVAGMLARFHSVPVDVDEKPLLWPKLKTYFSLIPKLFTLDTKRKRFEEKFPQGLNSLENEIICLEKHLEGANLKAVFCHNDLLLGNVIHHEGRVTFIDYEYAGCNYQAFDIGNHFTEFAGVNDIDFARIPDKEFQIRWLKLYLEELKACTGDESDVSSEEVETLHLAVNKFILVSHIFWSTWALVQAEISELDFDFIDYASLKMADYHSRKPNIMS